MQRTLVHLCSLLVLMPVGWCCWLVPVVQASANTQEASCPGCCCCGKQKKSAPSTPKETPRKAPCGCTHPAARLIVPEDADAPLPMLHVFVEIEAVLFSQAITTMPVLRIDARLPLNLLHCVWLC